MDRRHQRARASAIRTLFLLFATTLVAAFGVVPSQATTPRQADAAPLAATSSDHVADLAPTAVRSASTDRSEPTGTQHLPSMAPEAIRPPVALAPAVESTTAPTAIPRIAQTRACGRAPPA